MKLLDDKHIQKGIFNAEGYPDPVIARRMEKIIWELDILKIEL